jgi:hypothetical protein
MAIPESQLMMEQEPFRASNLTISTCTVLCNLGDKINLEYLTRFVPIYEINHAQLDEKNGGIYNMEFYGNCARGETMTDRIKDEFNNQTTIKIKYWGFRMINVKVFRNGKLQMTGLKYEDEASIVGNILINIMKQIRIPINLEIESLITAPATYDMQIVWDGKLINYYRQYYNRFLKNFKFNLEELYKETHANANANANANATIYNQITVDIKRKNYIKGIHDVYLDNENHASKLSILEEKNWYCDKRILEIIDIFYYAKGLFEKESKEILSSSANLKILRSNLLKLKTRYLDFKYPELNNILDNIIKEYYQPDEQTLIEVKSKINDIYKEYKKLLEKKINRLMYIRNCDVSICDNITKYLSINYNNHAIHKCDSNKQLILSMLELENNPIYNVSNIETVMINSDLTVNYNINLKKMAKLLKKKGIFNTYDPDEHSAVNLKYYWNRNNAQQGFCNCNPHCSTKEKKSICSKITVLIFRPGSIIITGSRTVEQLQSAHTFAIKILEETMNAVRIDEKLDDTKQMALLNNEQRKISRKPRLFFIKKDKIINPVVNQLQNPLQNT